MSTIFFRNVLTASPVWMWPSLGGTGAGQILTVTITPTTAHTDLIIYLFAAYIARMEGVDYFSMANAWGSRFRKRGRASPHRRLCTQAAGGQPYHVLE